ncbi:hypothetical protein [Chitinophaga rhizosphaerae]|uniref:hypothetical protein n=1 Tax=Chitinophaga rhizosphaerae TaxID=1864947 RepID=UPI000F811354|nr:hypothetical protein [Chitinophaga rhizosphaerae]
MKNLLPIVAMAFVAACHAGPDTIRVLTAPEGITFEVNQKMFCTGLIVHATGADPSASYLPFLPGAVKTGPQP